MPGQDLANFDAVLKEDYASKLRATINKMTVLQTRLNRTSDKWDFQGRRGVLPINIRPSESVGARPDGGQTPSPQRQTFVEMLVPMVYNYGTIKVTLPSIKTTQSDAGSFERVLDAEMKGIRRDLKNDINRQMWGDGFGTLARCDGAGVSTTAMILNPGHFVKRNMIIDVYTAATGGVQQVDSVRVASTTGATTVTLETAQSWSDTAFVFREDARGHEMMGAKGIIDDGTFVSQYFGLSRTTYPEMQSQVLDNGGTLRAITLDLLQEAFMESEIQGEGSISMGTTEHSIWRKIGNLMVPDRRYAPTMKLAGGFTALEFNGKPIIADRDHPRSTFYWWDESEVILFELAQWDFDDTDGSVLHKVAGEAAYEALLYYYAEMASPDPACHVAIRDIIRT